MAKEYFGHGRIRPKTDNPDVLMFSIQSRTELREHVLPVLKDMEPFSSRTHDYRKFADVLARFERREHRTREGLATIVRIAYSMNSSGKYRKQPIEPILDRILRGHTPNTL